VLLEVVGDLVAHHGSLHVGCAKVDAGPHSGVDDLLERVREPVEAPRGTGFVAEGAEADLVVPKKFCNETRFAVPRSILVRTSSGRAHESVLSAQSVVTRNSRLLFLAEFLESGVGAQSIPHRIEPKKGRRNRRAVKPAHIWPL
jgi:hypothetical protein